MPDQKLDQLALSTRALNLAAEQSTFEGTDGSVSASELQSTQDGAGGHVTEVTIYPPEGSIAAGAAATVQVICNAGKDPVKLRGSIECEVLDAHRGAVVNRTWVGYRADIQAPRVVLSPPLLQLGTVYNGIAVVREVVLSNLTDLEGEFKFVHPEAATASCHVQVDPAAGVLGPKQSCTVRVTITSTAAAVIDTLLACTIHGIKQSLPLAVRAVSKGVLVDIRVLGDDELDAIPTPLCDPDTPQYSGPKELLAISELPVLDFGDLRLYSRKKLRLVVRNLSAVPTSIAASVRDNPAAGDRNHSSHRTDVNQLSRTYQSKQGKEYMRSKLQKREDAKVLSGRSGVAFELTQHTMLLPGWGVVVLDVTAYNEMIGT